jgi:hypothetical protein
VEDEVSGYEITGILLAFTMISTSLIQAIWTPMTPYTYYSVLIFLTFLYVFLYQRCLERVRAVVRAVAFADDEEQNLLLMLEDEE